MGVDMMFFPFDSEETAQTLRQEVGILKRENDILRARLTTAIGHLVEARQYDGFWKSRCQELEQDLHRVREVAGHLKQMVLNAQAGLRNIEQIKVP